MAETEEQKRKRRLRTAVKLGLALMDSHASDDMGRYFRLPYWNDPADSVGISKFWGFTDDTLIGAAFHYVARWHDAREHYFDLPVYEAARFALEWARFIADRWPNKSERWRLKLYVRVLGPLLYVNAAKWRLRGKR